MQTWKTAFLTLLIFALGAVAGGLVTSKLTHARIEREGLPRPTGAAGWGTPLEADWSLAQLDVMERQVSLTPDQRRGIAEVMEKMQRSIQSLRDEWKSRMREMIQRHDREMLELLTPEQRPRFEEFRLKRRQFLQRRQPQGGPLRDRLEQKRDSLNQPPPRPQAQ